MFAPLWIRSSEVFLNPHCYEMSRTGNFVSYNQPQSSCPANNLSNQISSHHQADRTPPTKQSTEYLYLILLPGEILTKTSFACFGPLYMEPCSTYSFLATFFYSAWHLWESSMVLQFLYYYKVFHCMNIPLFFYFWGTFDYSQFCSVKKVFR